MFQDTAHLGNPEEGKQSFSAGLGLFSAGLAKLRGAFFPLSAGLPFLSAGFVLLGAGAAQKREKEKNMEILRHILSKLSLETCLIMCM